MVTASRAEVLEPSGMSTLSGLAGSIMSDHRRRGRSCLSIFLRFQWHICAHQGSHAAVFMDKQPPAYIFSYALPAAV